MVHVRDRDETLMHCELLHSKQVSVVFVAMVLITLNKEDVLI